MNIKMKHWKPFFIENSRVPVVLSFIAPIEINAITLFCFVFSRGEISERTKRHETIHFQQYLETLVLGFLLIYLWDYLRGIALRLKGPEAYMAIRAEVEAYENDHMNNYLETRTRWNWLKRKSEND